MHYNTVKHIQVILIPKNCQKIISYLTIQMEARAVVISILWIVLQNHSYV